MDPDDRPLIFKNTPEPPDGPPCPSCGARARTYGYVTMTNRRVILCVQCGQEQPDARPS